MPRQDLNQWEETFDMKRLLSMAETLLSYVHQTGRDDAIHLLWIAQHPPRQHWDPNIIAAKLYISLQRHGYIQGASVP